MRKRDILTFGLSAVAGLIIMYNALRANNYFANPRGAVDNPARRHVSPVPEMALYGLMLLPVLKFMNRQENHS